MNSKRQTIWLVSMLSLMVVLSAYYLFTEDASKMNTAKDASQTEQIHVNTEVTTPESINKTDTTTQATTDSATQGKTDSKAQKNKEAKTSTQATTKQLTDEAVLEKVAQQGKSNDDYFMAQQMQRNDNLAEQMKNLMTIITDSKQNTEAVSKAYSDLEVIQTRTAKINSIENELMKDYPNVIVTEAANKWKVVLQDNKLEKSQAVSIIDLVMKEMNIGSESVSIQVMPQ
ncbi:MAG: SpoIIIAH-like family protein [Paenibacillaceae bacterium]